MRVGARHQRSLEYRRETSFRYALHGPFGRNATLLPRMLTFADPEKIIRSLAGAAIAGRASWGSGLATVVLSSWPYLVPRNLLLSLSEIP
jgi:hypothetical protein